MIITNSLFFLSITGALISKSADLLKKLIIYLLSLYILHILQESVYLVQLVE